MTVAAEMLRTYPKDLGSVDKDALVACIEACLECTQACTACADAGLSEDMVAELTKYIRPNLACAYLCLATANVLSRHTGYDVNLTRDTLEACRQACESCADECEKHASMHEHCRVCAEACRRCEQACAQLLKTL